MTDNEFLLAISDMLDKKLEAKIEPIKAGIRDIKLDIENVVKPQLQLLTENYVPAAKRYEKSSNEIESLKQDVELMKKVITEHSEKLQRIS